jgi:hypothetical protein
MTVRKSTRVSITGRDGYIVAQALAYAHEAIMRLPARWREENDAWDMPRILEDRSTRSWSR